MRMQMRRLMQGVLAAAAAVSLAVPAHGEKLRILSYNVGLLKALGSDYVPLVDERAALVPQELARLAGSESLDIILLQEVWRARQAKAVVEALSPLGYSSARPRHRSITGLSSGLLLLVRSPLEIVEWSFGRFRSTTLSERFARKGVLEATLRDPRDSGTLIALVGVHTIALDTKGGEPADAKQLAAFIGQARQIIAALERRSEGGKLPALLLGDFNVGPGYADSAYRAIADVPGLVEAGTAVAPHRALVTRDPQNPLVRFGRYPNEPAAKIDHVFLRGGESTSWTVGSARLAMQHAADGLVIAIVGSGTAIPTPLSDHYGFLVEADLRRR